MTEISFYHLTTTPLERALPGLLTKMLESGHRALVVCGSNEHMEQLNQLLWTHDPASFIPHGSTGDDNTGEQPILLSLEASPVNAAKIVLLTHGQPLDNPEQFERVLDLFNGNDEKAVENARARWTLYKDNGYTLTYHRQTKDGRWDKKNH
ncbi:MAG: DNA polymerase III subunit chi [Alphaproteobacteria bacterium]